MYFSLTLDEFQSELTKLTRELGESKKETLTLNEELRKSRDKAAELEAERDHHAKEAERHQKAIQEREKAIEKVVAEMGEVKEQFEDYKRRIEIELSATKQSVSAMDDLSVQLEKTKGHTRQMEAENNALREDNRNLVAKVEELQEDIEGTFTTIITPSSQCFFECTHDCLIL